MNSIGCNISNLRKQNNMSQEQLAENLGVSRQSVSKWERDKTLPDLYNLTANSGIFGVNIDHLVKSKFDPTDATEISLSPDDINKRKVLVKKGEYFINYCNSIVYHRRIFYCCIMERS